MDTWSKSHGFSLLWCRATNSRPLSPDPPSSSRWVGCVYMFGGGCYYLESGHPDDVGLGVVGGAGWIVAFGRGAGWCGHADDGAGSVHLVTVQRNSLLKLGVQTGTTGEREETERLQLQTLTHAFIFKMRELVFWIVWPTDVWIQGLQEVSTSVFHFCS